MAAPGFDLREGSEADLASLAEIDDRFSSEWVLFLERSGDAVEQSIALRWRRAKPEGSTRSFGFDHNELLAALHRDFTASRLVIAESDGRAAGYLMLRESWNRGAELVAIIVDRQQRRLGMGRRFLGEAESFAREHGLRALQWEAQTDNRNAIEFAVSQGFRLAGINDALYRNDDLERQEAEDFRGIAVFLTKPLA